MQPVQNVVEQLVARNLTDKAPFGLAQIGINVFEKLFFGQSSRNFAHDGMLSRPIGPLICGCVHHASRQLFCQFLSNVKVQSFKSLNEFNYTHHPETKELGAIGNKKQNQRGFGMHSTLVVTPAGTPLGLLTQTFFTRPLDEPAHHPHELRRLPIEEKESYKWLQAFEQTLQLTPAGVDVVTVCDREADIYEMFTLAQQKEAKLLVRASADRSLVDNEVSNLWKKVEQQAVAGQLTVQIPKNQKRQARQATVSVRFTQVKLKPPWRPNQKKLPIVTLNAILVREENPPDDVDEPIEWLLLTNLPVTNFDDAVQVIKWYCCRWQIEIFHKVIKSGCTVEACRLQTADRLQTYMALMSVIAWRLHWLTYINRTNPDWPCTTVLTATEWQALYMRIHKTTALPETPPTVRQVVRWMAQLGGFLGRKRDGEPGVTVIWRGWQRLQDIAATWHLVKEQSQLVGNSIRDNLS